MAETVGAGSERRKFCWNPCGCVVDRTLIEYVVDGSVPRTRIESMDFDAVVATIGAPEDGVAMTS